MKKIQVNKIAENQNVIGNAPEYTDGNTNTSRNEIISSMIHAIERHGTRDIHYNIVDSAEYIQRCICKLPVGDPILPLIDRWLTLRPCKFNRWCARRGFYKVREKLIEVE